jgi:hypothetical protein
VRKEKINSLLGLKSE